MSAVGAKSLRMLHVSEAVVGSGYPTSLPIARHTGVLFYPGSSRLCAAKYCQPLYSKGDQSPCNSLRIPAARTAALLR